MEPWNHFENLQRINNSGCESAAHALLKVLFSFHRAVCFVFFNDLLRISLRFFSLFLSLLTHLSSSMLPIQTAVIVVDNCQQNKRCHSEQTHNHKSIFKHAVLSSLRLILLHVNFRLTLQDRLLLQTLG